MDKAIKNIKNDVADQAKLVIDQIRYEIDMLHDEEVDDFMTVLAREQAAYLEKQLSHLEVFAVSEESRLKMEGKRKLLALREELVSSLFAEVEQDLIAFRDSKEYKDYLVKKLNQAPIDKGVIYCRKEDMEIMKSLIKDEKVTIKERYFKLGGFSYIPKSEDCEYDYSLDGAFKEQIKWFIDHSGFTI